MMTKPFQKSYRGNRYQVWVVLVTVLICLLFLVSYVLVRYPFRSAVMSVSMSGPHDESFPPRSVELLFVGDIMLSRDIGSIMEEKSDWTYPFALMREFTADADIAFGNLESVISSRGRNVGSIYSFRADPRSVEGLVSAGIDVVSFANNHVWDYGNEAFLDTFEILSVNGIRVSGAGETFEEVHTPAYFSKNGLKIAYLSYTDLAPQFLMRNGAAPAVAFAGTELVTEDIMHAKEGADVVVVSFHFGEEYQTTHNTHQERLARASIDAGADIVVGHHPHVPQEIERYKDGVIAYSLGNFVFDQNFSADTRRGLALRVSVGKEGIVFAEHIDLQFTDTYQPYVVSVKSI